MNSTSVQYWRNFEEHLILLLLISKSNLEQQWSQWKYTSIKFVLGDSQTQEELCLPLEFK